MSTRKIKVNLKPVADQYASTGERIVEYSSAHGGGLISFRLTDDGYLVVDLYREDGTVLITTDNRHKTNVRPTRDEGQA
jgi:hypothetical protein